MITIIIVSILFGVTYDKILINGLFKNWENFILGLFGTKTEHYKKHNLFTELLSCPYCLSGQLSFWLSVIYFTTILNLLLFTFVTILIVYLILKLWK